MKPFPQWQFDEARSEGVDYASIEEVAAYDGMHRRFRDYEKAAASIIQRLGLGPESVAIDMGSGTGAFALHAAAKYRAIHAVDISKAMLDYTRREADRAGIKNVAFHHAGLLTYDHQAEPADAIVCVAVLHHLPDFWKQVALTRCFNMLKPGGKLFLFDIVFPSASKQLPEQIDGWIQTITRLAGEKLGGESAVHVRDEYSTYDWILEGMLRHAGFQIDTAEYTPGFQTTYICSKP
jgi:ubiquinone/menaquinone biosynthesis C-methylase UbiE